MRKKTLISTIVTATLAFGVLAGCGQSSSSGGSASNTIKIAVQTPLSGGSATLGEAIKLGSQLALEDQSKTFKDMGFTLQLVPYDDQADPKKGVTNANLIGADEDVLGVVGHLNSGVTIPSSEVYEKYKLTSISPASTATEVTDRNLSTVNRIVARDDFQGPAGAEFAVNTLKVKKIFIIQDKTSYGSGLADNFRKGAEKLGADILGYEGITVGEKDFNGVLNTAKAKNPDLIYFGGLYAEGGLLIKQARDKGLNIPIMGGDGLDSSTLVEIAGDAVKNTYLTSVAGDANQSDSGKKFAAAYKKKFNKDVESYSAYGYDSMGVLLQGIKDAIKNNGDKKPSREQVTKAVRAIKDYQGVMTKVGFDNKGDNTFAKIYIYKFDKAAYPAVQEGVIDKK